MDNNRFIFAITICFFTIEAIPAKTSVQTPILSKIYAITFKKIIPTTLLLQKTHLNNLKNQIKNEILFDTKNVLTSPGKSITNESETSFFLKWNLFMFKIIYTLFSNRSN